MSECVISKESLLIGFDWSSPKMLEILKGLIEDIQAKLFEINVDDVADEDRLSSRLDKLESNLVSICELIPSVEKVVFTGALQNCKGKLRAQRLVLLLSADRAISVVDELIADSQPTLEAWEKPLTLHVVEWSHLLCDFCDLGRREADAVAVVLNEFDIDSTKFLGNYGKIVTNKSWFDSGSEKSVSPSVRKSIFLKESYPLWFLAAFPEVACWASEERSRLSTSVLAPSAFLDTTVRGLWFLIVKFKAEDGKTLELQCASGADAITNVRTSNWRFWLLGGVALLVLAWFSGLEILVGMLLLLVLPGLFWFGVIELIGKILGSGKDENG